MSLLASGTYRYWRDGVAQAITEPWQLRRSTEGLQLTGQRLLDDTPLLDVEAIYREGVCTALHVHWQAAPRARRVRYQIVGPSLQWRANGDAATASLPLPTGSLLFPLLRAATGPLLQQLQATPATVVVPNIRDAAAADFLHPLLSERCVRRVDDSTRHYHYQGGEYGEAGCDCWLDTHGLLQRYRWASPHGEWTVALDAFQAAPGFAGFADSDRSRPGVAR